jgi:hypothetical protein
MRKPLGPSGSFAHGMRWTSSNKVRCKDMRNLFGQVTSQSLFWGDDGAVRIVRIEYLRNQAQ